MYPVIDRACVYHIPGIKLAIVVIVGYTDKVSKQPACEDDQYCFVAFVVCKE